MTPFVVIALGCIIICISCSTDISLADERPAPDLTSYIFLGEDVSSPVPYIVSIQSRKYTPKWRHLCGGSIISTNYILTAAHCLEPRLLGDMKTYRIRAGSNNLRKSVGTSHKIVSYTRHPQYVNEFGGYDIGVLKVHPRFKFNQRTISKIRFESSERVLDDVPVIFHGWGYTHFGHPNRLQEAYFTTLSDKTCMLKGYPDLSSTDFCVTNEYSSFPHVGDSGGPLVNEEKNLQLGVCSYGKIYNIPINYSYPVVFTRVSEFSKWIKDAIRK